MFCDWKLQRQKTLIRYFEFVKIAKLLPNKGCTPGQREITLEITKMFIRVLSLYLGLPP